MLFNGNENRSSVLNLCESFISHLIYPFTLLYIMWEDPVTEFTPISKIAAPVVHPDKENRAFGSLVLPVLKDQLASENSELQKRALRTLCEQLYNPEKVSSDDFPPMIPLLSKFSYHSDEEVRMLLAQCLAVLTMCPVGRKVILDYDLLRVCFWLVEDGFQAVRDHAIRALRHVSLSSAGVDALVGLDAMTRLLRRLPLESLEAQRTILEVLRACYSEKLDRAYRPRVVRAVSGLFRSPCPLIRKSACAVMAALASGKDGPVGILDSNKLLPLFNSCFDADSRVRAQALEAVMLVAVQVPTKIVLLKYDAVNKLLPLLEDSDNNVCLNCIRTLMVLGEDPGAKKFLRENISKILVHMFRMDERLKSAAKRAAEFITASPLSLN